MKRELTRREKVLLVILAVMVIGLGYFKLIYEPVSEQIASYESLREQEQAEITSGSARLAQMRRMEKAVEDIKATGEERAIPHYDNSGALMRELYQILGGTVEYSLDFSEATHREGYIIFRPVTLAFRTETYAEARSIIDALEESGNINQVSDVSITSGQGQQRNQFQTELVVTYFEVAS